MGQFRSALISLIRRYRLDFRSNQWKGRLLMVEQGLLSEDTCKMLLPAARAKADQIEDEGDFLWRLPDEDELYAEGKPDIELGSLCDDEQLRVGVRFKDRPRNILIVGSAGVGKTVTVRPSTREENGQPHGLEGKS
jgi:Cdc6-like AAA superfamily ATPase